MRLQLQGKVSPGLVQRHSQRSQLSSVRRGFGECREHDRQFAPVGTRMTVTQAGATYQPGAVASKGLQKKWLPTNFRLQIAGLEADCQRAYKIGAIGVRIVPAANKSASLSPTSHVPLRMQPSNLAVTIPEMDSGAFHNWYQDFVIRGNNS